MSDILIMLVGILTGFLSGLLGVGGGTLLVPALVMLAGLTQHQAQGISLAVMIPTAALGAWGYYKLGHLRIENFWQLVGGAAVGAVGGAMLANVLPAAELKRIFGGFIIFLAVKLLWDEFKHVSK
ncbi:MAG: sulfite exporter TauE/SafE family protein [Candidatus Margulisiibacteriota bacterium]